jgi:hypothetical protein
LNVKEIADQTARASAVAPLGDGVQSLSITRGLVELHGGVISRASSEPAMQAGYRRRIARGDMSIGSSLL